MIEKTILNYLSDTLKLPVYTEIPDDNIPQEFVIVEKTGSGRENHIENATLAIKSYSDSMLHAAQLNERVKDAMDDASILSEIFSSELNSDYPFNDTSNKKYRYQAVYDVYF